jgi:cell division transport system permease protein
MRRIAPPLLTLQRERPGTFAFLIGVTALLLMAAASLTLALHAAGRDITRQSGQRMLVQIVYADARARDATAAEAERRLRLSPQVQQVTRMPEAAAKALVAPYIGDMADPLPLPVLFDVRASDPPAATRLVADLSHVQVTRAAAELAPLRHLVAALEAVAAGAALVAVLASALIATLAARAAFAREAATLDILHAIGATDRQLVQLIGGKIARDAVIGAVAGAVSAVLVILLILSRLARAGLTGATLGWTSWLALLLLPLLLVILAVTAAQGALLIRLRRAP